jgi:predicted kinase
MLYILRGLPGSGKSTLARQLAPNDHYEADAFMVDKDGHYSFDPTRLGEVHEKCLNAVREALTGGAEVVAVANTFVKRWEYQRYIDLATSLGVDYEVIVCSGDYQNIHGVPQETILRMKSSWED